MADDQTEVYSPDGRYGVIPSSQVDDAKAQGYRLKDDYVEAVHPQTGKTGIIPKEQWDDAQKQGFAMSPWEQQRIKAKAGAAIQPEQRTMALPIGTGAMGAPVSGRADSPQIQQAQESMRNLAIGTGTTLAGVGAGAAFGGGAYSGKAGADIIREGAKYGPGALARAYAHPIGREIVNGAVKGTLGAIGAGTVWEVLKTLGIVGKK